MEPSSETLRPATRKPSEVTDAFWVSAWRRGGGYPAHTARGGKWLVFMPKADVDKVWARIVAALDAGKLGDDAAKVSTARPSPNASSPDEEVVCVYTYDGDDEADVWRVRKALRRLGFTQPLGWKSDQATRAGLYEDSRPGGCESVSGIGLRSHLCIEYQERQHPCQPLLRRRGWYLELTVTCPCLSRNYGVNRLSMSSDPSDMMPRYRHASKNAGDFLLSDGHIKSMTKGGINWYKSVFVQGQYEATSAVVLTDAVMNL